MGQPFELGQLGNYITVNDNDLTVGIGTSVSINGTLSATSLVGDGSGLTGTGIVVSTRNGLAGVNSTGDEVTNVTALRFDSNSGLAVTSLGPGEAFVNFGSSFNPYTVQGQDSLDATGEEELEIIAGSGIQITTNANSTPKSITFTNNATTIEYSNNAGISTNVIGGIGSVTELYSSGISTLAANGGITTTGGSLFTKQLSVAGVVTATSFSGDGSGLSNTGATLSAASGNQKVVLTSLSSGVMTTAATNSSLTYNSSTGTLSATAFSGDGSGLSNTGATLSAGSGTQRVALTSLTSGIMTSAATNSSLTYNSSTGTLSATAFSGDGSNLSNTGATLSAGSGTQRVALTSLTSGIMTTAATNSSLTYNSSTGTLSATAFSGDGSGLSNTGATLSAGSGTQRVALTSLTSGIMTTAATNSSLTYNSSTGTLSATAFSGDGSNLSNTGATLSAASGNQKVVLTSLTSGVMTTAATDSELTYNQSNNTLDASISGIASVTSEWIIGADAGNTYYKFTGPGFDGTEQDPTIYLTRGQRYKFTNNLGAHPFRIQSTVNGSVGTQYNDGLSTNDIDNGTIVWNVQMDSPSTLYYQCTAHTGMGGIIKIANPSDSPTVTALAYSTTPNVLETNATTSVRCNGSLVLQTSSTRPFVQMQLKSNYANTFGGQRTNEGAIVFKLLGSDNIVIGGYSAGGSITYDSYWGCIRNTLMGGPGSNGADVGSNMSVSNNDCTYIGAGAGSAANSDYNTAVGSAAGQTNNPSSTGNCTAIGYNAQWTAGGSNEIVLGNNQVLTLRCNTQTISTLSDRRDKKNIEDIPVGLNYINALRPVKFDWARRDKSYQGQKAFGFIAQELNEVQEQFGYKEYTKLVYEQDPDRLEASSMNTYPILVKAVQELSQQNQDLLRRIEELENRLNGG